ncbi:MAG TPA: ABC transporter permease [Patescibacteria group bacterium]|nr:ABC transporter permease [Patescibacteria group bacterium]
MNLKEIFRTAITALRSSLLRTGLTMLGIIIGIMAVILILIISQGATAYINGQFSSLGSNLLIFASTGIINITTGDVKALGDPGEISNVAEVGSRFAGNETVSANGQNKSEVVFGASASMQDILGIVMQSGSFVGDDDNANISRVAVLGPTVVKDLFGEGADPIGQNIEVGTRPFRVIGVTASKNSQEDGLVIIPVSTAMRTIFGVAYVQAAYVNVKDARFLDQTEADAKALIFERHSITDQSVKDNFVATNSRDILSTINNVLGILTVILSGIAGISLLVGGIGIMNIMLVTVTERTKEIGLLKAIGATRRDILTQFLIESIILTVTGGAIGIILGIGIGYIIAQLVKVPFGLPIIPVIASVSVSVIIGIIFGSYPAYSASKLSPIDALHYE